MHGEVEESGLDAQLRVAVEVGELLAHVLEPLEGVALDVHGGDFVARVGEVHLDHARGTVGVGAVETAVALAQAAPVPLGPAPVGAHVHVENQVHRLA